MHSFTIDALLILKDQYGTPHLGRPRYRDRSWSRDKREPETLRASRIPKVWLQRIRTVEYSSASKIRSLSSYAQIVDCVMQDETMRRRFYAAFGVVGSLVYKSEEDQIYLALQDELLTYLVEKTQAFDVNLEVFAERYGKFEEAFAHPVVSQRFYISLRNSYLPRPLELNSHTSVRELTEEELSNGINCGVIRLRSAQGYGDAYVPHEDQFAICFRKDLHVTEDLLSNPNFKQIVDAAVKTKLPRQLARRFVISHNLYSEESSAEIGGIWTETTVNLYGFLRMIELDNSHWESSRRRRLIADEEDTVEIGRLFRGISRKRIWDRLGVALARFSAAASRLSDGEAIVDLAIAAESLFGSSYPGEATHKISLNAALFLGTPEMPSSEIRAFFRSIYGARSAVVHGVAISDDDRKSLATKQTRYLLERVMRMALKKAISELSDNPSALSWDKRLDEAIDSVQWTSGTIIAKPEIPLPQMNRQLP